MVDIPTVILSFTAPFAAVGYLTILRRVEDLIPDLKHTGLVLADKRSARAEKNLQSTLRRVVPKGWVSGALFVVSAALTTWLYLQNLRSGGIFDALASPAVPENVLRHRWWADYRTNPLLAVHCIFVGAVGVHFAFASAWLYANVGAHLLLAKKREQLELNLQYVPRWSDRSFGWSPATRLIMLSYGTGINFAISMIAIYDMLKTGSVNRAVAGTVAAFGLLTNLALIVLTLRLVVQAHRRVGNRLRRSVTERIKSKRRRQTSRRRKQSRSAAGQLSSEGTAASMVLSARDAESWPSLPIANKPLGLLKIMPGLYAIYQLTRTLGGD